MGNYTRGFLREEDLAPSSSITENLLRMVSPIRIANALAPVAHDNEGHYEWALPSAIADPMESWKGMVDRHRSGIYDDAADARDAFSVAGSVGLGSVAAAPLKPSNALGAMGKGIRAYHGSPYDFDKFDLSKINTGEGAQAFGHGLYFAENPEVANLYRNMLSGKKAIDNTELDWNDPKVVASMRLHQFGGDKDKTISWIKTGKAEGYNQAIPSPKDHPFTKEVIEHLENGTANIPVHKGHMYEVNLKANPEDFLNWDKKLTDADFEKLSDNFNGSLNPHYDELARLFEYTDPNSMTGKEAYQWIGHTLKDEAMPDGIFTMPMNASEIADELKNAGFAGIKYPDQDGHNRQNILNHDTSNYVVFDPEIIDILRKYANPPTSSAIPLSIESNDNERQPLRGGFGPRWETQPQNALSYKY